MRMLDSAAQRQAWKLALDTALQRLDALRSSGLASPDSREALLFTLERAAWAVTELLSLEVTERRLGIPKGPSQAIELLVRDEVFAMDEGRRLRMAVESRNLSSREPSRLRWDELLATLEEDLAVLGAAGAKLAS